MPGGKPSGVTLRLTGTQPTYTVQAQGRGLNPGRRGGRYMYGG